MPLKYFYRENLALFEYGVRILQNSFRGEEFSTCFNLLALSFLSVHDIFRSFRTIFAAEDRGTD